MAMSKQTFGKSASGKVFGDAYLDGKNQQVVTVVKPGDVQPDFGKGQTGPRVPYNDDNRK